MEKRIVITATLLLLFISNVKANSHTAFKGGVLGGNYATTNDGAHSISRPFSPGKRGRTKPKAILILFVNSNIDNLISDIARGEALSTLAAVWGISTE